MLGRYATLLHAMDDTVRKAFLDEVEAELGKLLDEREKLRQIEQRIATLQSIKSHINSLVDGQPPVAATLHRLRETTYSRFAPVVSLPDAIKLILTAAQRPMHVKELRRELQKREHPINAKDPLTAIVAAMRRRREFVRVAPNTYALRVDEDLARVGS